MICFHPEYMCSCPKGEMLFFSYLSITLIGSIPAETPEQKAENSQSAAWHASNCET